MTQKGWADHTFHGENFDRSNAKQLTADLQVFFEARKLYKGRKRSVRWAHESLEVNYPRRADIPSEQSIIPFILSLV